MFANYLQQWRLEVEGDPLVTRSSQLLAVSVQGLPAMLKIALVDEERVGGQLMNRWAGDGAARVYARGGDALLMERAQGPGCLLHMALNGEDDRASRIVCATLARLHRLRAEPLIPHHHLAFWFTSLRQAACGEGGILLESARVAEALLADPRDIVVLHGDAHHRNILDFGERGWLAIDPKGLVGERGFDFAHLLCNPELATGTDAGRFSRQVAVIAEAAGLERGRLLQWVLAYAGLSAAWFLEDGDHAGADSQLQVAGLAAAALRLQPVFAG